MKTCRKFISILPLLVLSVFLLIRSFLVVPTFSDETIYINMAKALKEGLLPYKDFFYAHPPLQLLLLFPVAQTGNFFLTKIYISLIGLSCVFLTYIIAKEIFGRKAAFISLISFFLFPGFIIFGNLAMGTFEALLFFLLSFYFLLKNRLLISAILMSLSFYTRYLVLLLIPFVLLYLLKYKRKEVKKFLVLVLSTSIVILFVLYTLFGSNFIIDTVFYHFESNIKIPLSLANWIWQYFSLGFFTIFISLLSLTFGYFKKDYKIMLFSAYPLIYDLIVLLIFRQVIYHYFAFALPLIFIVFGKVFSSSKFKEVKIFLILILALSIFTNLQSLIYYFDESINSAFVEVVNYTLENTEKDDLIFGEPRMINFVSFVTNRKIVNNYFDSDLKHLNFKGLEKVVSEIKEAKPKIIIADANFYEVLYINFEDEYKKVKEWNKPRYFHLILMERKGS